MSGLVDERLPHSARRYVKGCRCLFCTDAHEAREMAVRNRRPKCTAPHGTVERLMGGCRCQACRHARKAAMA